MDIVGGDEVPSGVVRGVQAPDPDPDPDLGPAPTPWHRNEVVVTLAVVLCFPVGLALVWLQPWRAWVRAGLTAIVLIAVVAVFATIGGSNVDRTPRSAPAATSTSPFLQAWGPRRFDVQRELLAISDASTDITLTFGSTDRSALQAACGELRAASGRLRAALPTPDAALTDLLREVADHYEDAAIGCTTADPSDPVSLSVIKDPISAGTDAVERVVARLNQLKGVG